MKLIFMEIWILISNYVNNDITNRGKFIFYPCNYILLNTIRKGIAG